MMRNAVILFCVLAALGIASFHFYPIGRPDERMPPNAGQVAALKVTQLAYKQRFGSFPNGDTVAISQALRGDNPTGTILVTFKPNDLSPKGEPLDAWGTPFRIYFSGEEILIRSAGMNRCFDLASDKEDDDLYY